MMEKEEGWKDAKNRNNGRKRGGENNNQNSANVRDELRSSNGSKRDNNRYPPLNINLSACDDRANLARKRSKRSCFQHALKGIFFSLATVGSLFLRACSLNM